MVTYLLIIAFAVGVWVGATNHPWWGRVADRYEKGGWFSVVITLGLGAFIIGFIVTVIEELPPNVDEEGVQLWPLP